MVDFPFLSDQLEAALNSRDRFAADAPNVNAWPQPNVRRKLAEWLAARVEITEQITDRAGEDRETAIQAVERKLRAWWEIGITPERFPPLAFEIVEALAAPSPAEPIQGDCPGCGAPAGYPPAGYPPAGPCENHGTKGAVAALSPAEPAQGRSVKSCEEPKL